MSSGNENLSSERLTTNEKDTSITNEYSNLKPDLGKSSLEAKSGTSLHNVSINISGNYAVSISRKGNTKLSFDKESLGGTLVLDGNTEVELRVPIVIKKFKISKNLKKIDYVGSIQSQRLTGEVSGRLRFQNPIDVATSDDQALLPQQKSSLKIVVKEPQVIVKKGSRGKIEFNQTGKATISS